MEYPIRNARWLGWLPLVLGAVLLTLNVLIQAPLISILLGVLVMAVGVGTLRVPPVVITLHEVQQRNLLGAVVRRQAIESLADLQIEQKRLVQVSTGKRIAYLGVGMRRGDIEALATAIAST